MIEEVIHKALMESDTLKDVLATYDDEPAVFYAKAANGSDEGWSEKQYPRCVYMVDWMHDEDRNRSGVLMVDILCQEEAPEDLGESLLRELSGLFMYDGEQTCNIVWSRTEQFEVEGSEPLVSGVTVYFDILEYPVQITTTPDPVLSTMRWVKAHQNAIHVIGIDENQEMWKATNEKPVCYVRIEGETSTVKPTYMCVWMNANVVVHIICPNVKERLQWLKKLADILAFEAEIITDDGSPMFVKNLKVNNGSNQATDGQLFFSGEYGVLRKSEEKEKLQNAYFGWGYGYGENQA